MAAQLAVLDAPVARRMPTSPTAFAAAPGPPPPPAPPRGPHTRPRRRR